ncbi:MAG TPA: hypothetical protein VEV41_28630 [Terriglobales bacterium]|jgi:hypothetical protein|nr:hypothetical protein [Terriglobales bacterium]
MAEVIYDKRAAIRNTVLYAVAFAACVALLVTRHSWIARGLCALGVVWAVGGIIANWQAINHGFVDPDR